MNNRFFGNRTESRGLKRGYPNPNYTDADVRTMFSSDETPDRICLDIRHYEELIAKATALDLLITDIKTQIDLGGTSEYGVVNEKLVLAVTGLSGYLHKKEAEADANGQD